MADTPRAYQIERDRFALMYSGPHVAVGEMREVYEASDVDAERERMLDLIERMLAPDRPIFEQAEGEAEELLQADGRLSGKDKTDRCTNSTCDRRATRIAGNAMQADCFYAAPYCEMHAREVVEGGGRYVAGPALSLECAKIEGIR